MSDLLTARVAPDGRLREAQAAPSTNEPTPRRNTKPRLFLLAADLTVAEACFLLALGLSSRFGPGQIGPQFDPAPVLLAVVFPLMVAGAGLYREASLTSWRSQAGVGLRVLAWSVVLSVGALLISASDISWDLRLALLLYEGMLGVWLLAARPWTALALSRSFGCAARAERVLMVGADALARDIARSLGRFTQKTEILGFAHDERPRGIQLHPFFHTDISDVPVLARTLEADLVVLARPDLPRAEVIRLCDELVAEGRRVNVVSNVFNRLVDSLPFETTAGVPLVVVGQSPLHGFDEVGKRIFDVVATTMGGLLISPLLLGLALLVRVSSPGPIIYTQRRIGRDGTPFNFYKFRTMRVNGDDTEHRAFIEDYLKNGAAAAVDGQGKKIFKLVDDARVTPIGRFLRRTSLDELPQLINVLRGEMSLIGPRPCLPFEWELYSEWQKRRLSVTPGMTGLWQVTGRSYVTFEDMVLLDLFYIANWSFLMDVKILLRTIPVVIWGKGGV